MTTIPSQVSAEGLAKILLIQSMANQMSDEKAILDFVCRGLEEMPGAGRAYVKDAGPTPEHGHTSEAARCRFPVKLQGKKFAEIIVEIENPELFDPYLSFIQNLCFTVAVMMEEKWLRRDNERHQQELELRVEERTRQLREEVREREAAERRAVAEKLRAERYLEVAEAITLELDPLGRIAIINKWGAEILGYAPQELIGRDWFDVAIPPEQRESIREILREIVSGNLGPLEYFENEIVTRDGERRLIAWHNALRRAEGGQILGTLSFGSDITESKAAERLLRVKQNDLDHAQAVAHLGNWRLNVHSNELAWSDEVYRIFGVEKGSLLTYAMFLSFVHPEDRAFVDTQWKAAMNGTPYDIDHRIIVNGGIKWVREKAEMEFDERGNLLGGFGTVQDITDRKQLEFDLLDSMRAAEEANRAKSQFLANMSHELRTPLTVIMGALGLMGTKIEGPELQQLLGMADDSADQLLRIITELLDFSLIDAGQLRIDERSFDLRKCTQQVVEMFTSPARGKGIELDLAISPDLPVFIIGDPNRLEQVLKHLVENAVKFTQRGRVEVSVAKHQKKVAFTVRDTGIGISPSQMKQIFDPFTQVDGSMTRPYGGTGLGLALSKELVELMGGKIQVQSELGHGSTFTFSLPLKVFRKKEEADF
jgi:PAS domain S-box-containing protein